MTYVDDLYEPADRGPGEPDPEPTYTLDQIQGALTAYLRGQDPRGNLDAFERSDADQAESFLLDTAVPLMLAELREARRRIAEWEALEKREEWAVTARRDVEPSKTMPLICETQQSLDNALKVSGGVAWVRRLTVHPWEPVDSEAPF